MQSLARRLEQEVVFPAPGITQAAQPFLGVLLRRLFPSRPVVVVADGLKTQESFEQDIETWLRFEKKDARAAGSTPDWQALFYPAWEILPHESRLPHVDTIADRLRTLLALSAPGKSEIRNTGLIVTSVAALLQRTFAPEALRARTRPLARGDRVDPLDLVEWLEAQGYEPEAQVTQKGELAVRGGIVDLYPLTTPWPVRLEFFGDELESLRYFDPVTQVSREEIVATTVPPGGELTILKKTSSEPAAGDANDTRTAAPPGTLLDYLPRDTIFLLCNPDLLAERAGEYAQQALPDDPFFIEWERFRAGIRQRGMAQVEVSDFSPAGSVANHGLPIATDVPEAAPGSRPVGPDSKSPTRDWQEDAGLDAPLFASLDAFRPLGEKAPEPQVAEAQRREFFEQLHRWLRQGCDVHIFCNNDGERQRFDEIWTELGLDQAPGESGKQAESLRTRLATSRPFTHLGSLSRGFICDEAKVIVVTDAEIFGRYKVQRPRRLKTSQAPGTRSAFDIDFTELEEGDLVVHVQHGIGRFLGLRTLPTGLGTKPTESAVPVASTECLVIEYAASDPLQPAPKLYVPVTEAHLVGKYVGAGKARPPLNTLGGTRWKKAKEQAERAVRDVAGELLSIQAARDSQPGHAFAADTPWQREFESAFIFEETPDQWSAIQKTKEDMERPKPMDRLICGDVGFGKTEVAIRAAFKAVMDGRQVAVLVPTTVLAQQHFNTFRERMADYPVRIELLSRFRTRRQQQRVVKDLASGAVDIVIGTHRLIQEDISFKELGLVVIDEEQRFGVMHKEKFKMLRQLVDVLTLSATPIPRTLYLALAGARDMSTIQTPPHDRLPVETIVTQYDERLIRDAIQRELNRGGQVFFLHNRVMTISLIEQKLRTLLPHARIVVGHGQMDSNELEEVMTRFVNGEADVLLSTTIIESGLDIPNANTIIIDRADRFGLSDLYQLRGRVGRYKHQAYAYLLLPRHARLLNDVRKRISAIRQYSTLGSGFKIAMRDLEIRGAGNLLGSEQSGHITAVGFELYCQLLQQSIAALKGEKVKPRVDVEVKLDLLEEIPPAETSAETAAPASEQVGAPQRSSSSESALRSAAFLPHRYVPEPQHRIEIYRKLAQATDKGALDHLRAELRDRFGPLPSPVDLLLQIGELKILASERGITAIEVKDDRLMLTRNNDYIMIGGKFPRLSRKTTAGKLKEIRKLLLAL